MEKKIKAALSIKVNGAEYIGQFTKLTKEELEKIEEYVIEIIKGGYSYVSLETDRGTVFFSFDVLKHSIITILKA